MFGSFYQYMVKFNMGTELRQNLQKIVKISKNCQKIAKSYKKSRYFVLNQWGYLSNYANEDTCRTTSSPTHTHPPVPSTHPTPSPRHTPTPCPQHSPNPLSPTHTQPPIPGTHPTPSLTHTQPTPPHTPVYAHKNLTPKAADVHSI